jgi:hypothetical protein
VELISKGRSNSKPSSKILSEWKRLEDDPESGPPNLSFRNTSPYNGYYNINALCNSKER